MAGRLKEKLEEAESMSKRLLELSPNNPHYLDTHGWVLFQQGNYESAVSYLEKAAQLSEQAVIFEHLGDAFFKLGQKEKAMENWKKAQSLETEANDALMQKIKTGVL